MHWLICHTKRSEKNMTNYSHLCKEQRNTIEHLLNRNQNFTSIGDALKVDRTTISKEIKRNLIIRHGLYLPFNKHGIEKAQNNCELLQKPPYVCNGCKCKNSCIKMHLYYNAKEAQKHYEGTLKTSREGVDITSEEVAIIEKNIVPLIKNKHQSVNQVFINHPDILYFSKVTFYKYIDEKVISLTQFDLPRKIRYKKRKNKNKKINKRDTAILINRRYEDYERFVSDNKNAIIWQLDTVIGRITDSKVLMTFMLTNTNFMIIRLLDKKDINHVDDAFTKIKADLGAVLYKKYINTILTDNGIEFFDPVHMEIDFETGEKLTNVFYCHPNSPEEKPELEKNHEYIRYYLPKKTSFDNLTEKQVKLIEDNINNVPREILGNKTPYELTKDKYPEVVQKLKSQYIQPDDVNLSPELLKGENHE